MNLKKLLSAIGLLAVATPATLSVVACGGGKTETNPSPEQKEANELKETISSLTDDQKKITVSDEENARTQIAALIDSLKEKDSQLNLVYTYGDYIPPTTDKTEEYETTVSITHETNKDVKAEAGVVFTLALKDEEPGDKTQLSDVIKTESVNGNEINDKANLLNFIVDNNEINKEDIQIKDEDFKKAEINTPGSAKIIPADGNEKYQGEVTITITALDGEEPTPTTPLDEVITNTEVDGNEVNAEGTVKSKIAELNEIDANDIDIVNFNAAKIGENGSATITSANEEKYTGSVDITIIALLKTPLEEAIAIREVDGNLVNTEEEVINSLVNSSEVIAITDISIEEFQAATDSESGHALVIATPESNFTGSVNIVISQLNTEAIEIIKKLQEAETKSPEKHAAWFEYVTYRFGVVKQQLDDGQITAELKMFEGATSDASYKNAFMTWVVSQFIFGLKEQTKALGIVQDYASYGPYQNENIVVNKDQENPGKGTIIYTNTWRMRFWEGGTADPTLDHIWDNVKDWEIPFTVNWIS